ncbi:unnamed protein product [Nesidiocoris tenuis]|uniref:Uncharacterized protein n=1 Tax=Nesidiocoris tenuis TaxID=355587 RepID=A0A6H5HGY8_9HEMI|nr:unnamed protein product [Nesidiocoris tenuis]
MNRLIVADLCHLCHRWTLWVVKSGQTESRLGVERVAVCAGPRTGGDADRALDPALVTDTEICQEDREMTEDVMIVRLTVEGLITMTGVMTGVAITRTIVVGNLTTDRDVLLTSATGMVFRGQVESFGEVTADISISLKSFHQFLYLFCSLQKEEIQVPWAEKIQVPWTEKIQIPWPEEVQVSWPKTS